MVTLWGGAIRFTTAMCFALAFLPMFGLGGVTGLPLGLAPEQPHPARHLLRGRPLPLPGGAGHACSRSLPACTTGSPSSPAAGWTKHLGLVHFAGSFVAMNAIFLPMFLMGIMGVNRRLYDGGLQYELGQSALRGTRT